MRQTAAAWQLSVLDWPPEGARMGSARGTADERYAAVVAALADQPGVTVGSGKKGFGSSALCIVGKIFDLLSSRGRFWVKVPRLRVAGGDAGRGRPRGTVRPRPRPCHEGVAGGRRRGGGRVAAAGPGGASVRGPQARRVGAPVRCSGAVLITSAQPDTSRSRMARPF